jgi:hypothetical protein
MTAVELVLTPDDLNGISSVDVSGEGRLLLGKIILAEVEMDGEMDVTPPGVFGLAPLPF